MNRWVDVVEQAEVRKTRRIAERNARHEARAAAKRTAQHTRGPWEFDDAKILRWKRAHST